MTSSPEDETPSPESPNASGDSSAAPQGAQASPGPKLRSALVWLLADGLLWGALISMWIILRSLHQPVRDRVDWHPEWAAAPGFWHGVAVVGAILITAIALQRTRTPRALRGIALPAAILSLALLGALQHGLSSEGHGVQGFELPTLEKAEARVVAKQGQALDRAVRLELAQTLFGSRIGTRELADDFSEADYLALRLRTAPRDPGPGGATTTEPSDLEPAAEPGLIHFGSYAIPPTDGQGWRRSEDLDRDRRAVPPSERGATVAAERAAGARVGLVSASAWWTMSWALGLHLAVLVVLTLRAAITRAAPGYGLRRFAWLLLFPALAMVLLLHPWPS